MGQRKAQELAGLAEHIEQQVQQAAVKHLDETGSRVAGGLQWLHVASTWLLTCYRTSAQRGAMLAGVRGIIVHDFWRSYLTMGGVLHALCNAHHLRELKALMDIEKEPWARALPRFLRQTCQVANLARAQQRSLRPRFLAWLSARYDRIWAQGLAFQENQPPLGAGLPTHRGRIRRRTGHNLLLRLRDHKEATLRFLYDPTVPFTNNQAERDLRMMKVRQKISGGFRSDTGAQTFAPLRTVLSLPASKTGISSPPLRPRQPPLRKTYAPLSKVLGSNQLFLLDEKGEVISRDIPRILGTIKCGPDQKGAALPAGYNKVVMQVKRRFIEEVKHRQAERDHTLSLTQGQRYVLRELRLLFGATTDEDEKAQVNILEKAFRGPILPTLNRELNLLRRNGVTGPELLKALVRLYYQHNMRDWVDRRSLQLEDQQIPKIVCSEALV